MGTPGDEENTVSEHWIRPEQVIEVPPLHVAGTDPERPWFTPVAPPEPEVPDLVAVWSLHHGGVATGARYVTNMGGRHTHTPDPSDDRCVLLTNGRELPGHQRNGGSLIGQGVPTLWGLHVWGVVTHGSIVIPPAGPDHSALLSTLRRFAEHAVERHATDWWTPAVVAFPDQQPRIGILFADIDCARRAATEVGTTRVVVVAAPAYANPTAYDANVAVEELDGTLVRVTLLLPSLEHVPDTPHRLATLQPTGPTPTPEENGAACPTDGPRRRGERRG